MKKRGLYWFTHDLRVADNSLMTLAAATVDEMACLYIRADMHPQDRHFLPSLSPASVKARFEQQSLVDLVSQLQPFRQPLFTEEGHVAKILIRWVSQLKISTLFVSRQVGWYERQALQVLSEHCPYLEIVEGDNHTVFALEQLPFELVDLANTFSGFRRRVEPLSAPSKAVNVTRLPEPICVDFAQSTHFEFKAVASELALDQGGRSAGLNHLKQYFASDSALSYKQTRNALHGSDYATHFSPWLSNGAVSVQEILRQLNVFESQHGSNESTYWIRFELLWREYFQWYALKYGAKLFYFSGINGKKPLTSFYSTRFRAWVMGETPYTLVNACMKELAKTGFLSNRARQIVASALVNELGIDWRYGAQYFQHVLIDHDVASNWGNWQYVAGVGADPRGGRHFDLAKQTRMFDPDGTYRRCWLGEQGLKQPKVTMLDEVGIDDWPLLPSSNSLK